MITVVTRASRVTLRPSPRCVARLLAPAVLLLAIVPACEFRRDTTFVQCHHCSAMLSPKAKACPRCGEPTAVADVVVNSIGMQLKPIAAGRFRMGASEGDPAAGDEEKPAHTVDIGGPFLIGVTEVTQGQFATIMDANPSAFAASGARQDEVRGVETVDFPVESVTWDEAVEFCDRLGQRPEELALERSYRLPTEAEWEFAATAAGRGTQLRGPTAAHVAARRPHAVGDGDADEVGLFGLANNVSEWTSDWFSSEYYVASSGRDPRGPKEGSVKSFRGGAWNGTPGSSRPTARDGDVPDARRDDLGFRVVCVERAGGGGPPPGHPGPTTDPPAPSPSPSPPQANQSRAVTAWKRAVVRLAVRTPRGEGQGSGFVIDAKGTVVTNFHVVDGAISVEAFFSDGFHESVEGVLGAVPDKDLAFLKLASGESRSEPLTLADSLPPEGRQVYALGCPLGLGFSLTEGIVSGIRSAAELREAFRSAGTPPPKLNVQWIQTTAPVNWGNSGGPLIDETGTVVGINTLVFGRDRKGGVAEGLNFAVSAPDVLQALRATDGRVRPLPVRR